MRVMDGCRPSALPPLPPVFSPVPSASSGVRSGVSPSSSVSASACAPSLRNLSRPSFMIAFLTGLISQLFTLSWGSVFVLVVVALIGYFYATLSTNQPRSRCSSRGSQSSNGAVDAGEGGRPRRVSTINEDDNEGSVPSRPRTLEPRRMRKRDWAKKVIKSFIMSKDSPSSTPEEATDDSMRRLKRRHSTAGPLQFAKDFVRGGGSYFRQNSEMLNRVRLPRPPVEFFEPTDLPEIPQNLSPEIFYVLHNLKMLELPACWKLNPRDIDVMKCERGGIIAQPGDADDAIYVALTGPLGVYIKEDGKEYLVKVISKGNSFFSLLSMLDVLMKEESKLKTVTLKALEAGEVAKFRITSLVDSYNQDAAPWVRPIQIVVTRLLHVTMTTLHQYMGLSSELMRRDPRAEHRSLLNASVGGGAGGGGGGGVVTGGEEGRNRQNSGGNERKTSVRMTQAGRPKFNRAQSVADGSNMIPGPAPTAPCTFSSLNKAEQMLLAKKWFAESLGLSAHGGDRILDNRFEIREFPEGFTFTEQGSDEAMLSIILSGKAILTQESPFDDEGSQSQEDVDEERIVCTAGHKELFGGLQLLTQEPAFFTVKSTTPCIVAMMSKENFAAVSEVYPSVFLPVAHSVLRRLSPFVRGVDFALDWVLVDSGQAVYRAGDNADALYVVLSGRLRSVEKKTVMEEFGRGDMLGMMEVLQHRPRATTVLAVRFSQLARVPEGLLNFIKMKYPPVGFRLVQWLGQYYSSLNRRNDTFVPSYMRSIDATPASGDPMSHIKNLHTVAVLPASADVPLVAFTCELYHALSANLRVLRLSSQKVAAHLDKGVLEKQADFRLMHWLNVQEDTYPLVIYECDYNASNWTRRCLRQADAILVVGMGTNDPPKQAFIEEQFSNADGIRTNKELILLWPEDTITPSNTFQWLKGSWFSGHHHIRAPSRMCNWDYRYRTESTEPEVVDFYEQNVFWESVDCRSDFSRLARILTGNAIGLVLGGGGARGAAHVGVIRAVRDAGIPVDLVGGTSIGSLIGGIFAESPHSSVEERARSWFEVMCSMWRKILDLTWGHSAMFTGAGFNHSIRSVFNEREIEDLWLSYFCISTDISTSEMRIHRSGPLWAYCRASMSLAGYLPPLCDPSDGHLLLDGGYVNNLPADVMRSMGARFVIAVDVGSMEEMNLYNYGEQLNGWWAAFRHWLYPGLAEQEGRILTNQEIQSRLAYVSCVRQLEVVKKAPYCYYMRPDIDNFMTLEFSKYDIILEKGLTYGRQKLQEMLDEEDGIVTVLGVRGAHLTRRQSRRVKDGRAGAREPSFTDLAAQASKIPHMRRRNSLGALDSMDEEDLYMCDSDSDYTMSSEFAEASESEEEGGRIVTPKPPLSTAS